MSNSGTRGPTPLDSPGGDYSAKEDYSHDIAFRSYSNNHSDNKISGLPPFSSFSGIEGLGSRLHMEGLSEGLSARLLDSDTHNIVFGDLYSEGLSARLIERGVLGNVHTNGRINGDQVRNSDTPSTTSVPQYRPWEAKPEPHSPVTTSTWPDSTGNIPSFTEAFTELGTNPSSGSLFTSQQKLPSFQSQFTAFSSAGDSDSNVDQGLPSFHILTNINPRMTSLVSVSPENHQNSNLHQYVGDQSFALENIPISSPTSVPSMQSNTQLPSPNSNHSSGYPRSASVKSELNDPNQFSLNNENMDAQRPRSHPMTGVGVTLESLTNITNTATYMTVSDRQNSNLPYKPIETAYQRKRESRKKSRTSSIEGSESDTSVSGSVDSVSQVASVSSTENTEGFKPPLNPMEDQEKPVKKKRKRCGECVGCQRKDNCGECAPCRNEKSHQICKMRRCEKLTEKRPNPRGEGKIDGRGRQSSGNSGQMMPMYNSPGNNSTYTLPSTAPITGDRNFGVPERFSSPICYQNQPATFNSNFNVIGSQHPNTIGVPYGQTIQAYEFATQGNFIPGNQHTPPPPYPVVTQSEISHSFVNSPQSNGGPPTPVSVGSDLSVNSNGPPSTNIQYIETSQPSSFGSPGGIIRNGQIILHERTEQTNLHIVLPAAHIPSFQSKGYHDLSFPHPQSLPSPHNNTGSPHNLNYTLERKSYADPGYPNGKPGYQPTKTPLKSSPSCSDDTDASSPRYSGDVRGAESTLRGHLLQERDWEAEGTGAMEVEEMAEVSTSVLQTGEEDDELQQLIDCVIPLNGLPKLDKMLDDFRNTTWSKSESPAFDNIPGFADKTNTETSMSPDQSDKSTLVSSSTQKMCSKIDMDEDLTCGPESIVHSTTSFEDQSDSSPRVRYLGMVASHQMAQKEINMAEFEAVSSVSSSSNFLVRKTTGTGMQVSSDHSFVSLPVVLKTMHAMGSFSLLQKVLKMTKTNVAVKLAHPTISARPNYQVKTLRFLKGETRTRLPSECDMKSDGFFDDVRHIESSQSKSTIPLKTRLSDSSSGKIAEGPRCSCCLDGYKDDNNPYYTHLGAASSLPELRNLMEQLSGESGRSLRFETLAFMKKPGLTPLGCPMAKWVRGVGKYPFDAIGGYILLVLFYLYSFLNCEKCVRFISLVLFP